METPTLEEVKKHFENAKEVYLLNTEKKLDISNAKIITDKYGYFFAEINGRIYTECYHNTLFSGSSGEYAKIISYKDETFTITKEFILDLHKEIICPSVKAKIEKEFPQLFEPKPIKMTVAEVEAKLGHAVEIVK